MSKIIYRKIRTAPGVKQYLDDEKTQVNPQFEASSAYYAQAVTLETLSLRDMAKHITSHGSPFTVDVATLTKDKNVSDEETEDDDITGGDNNGGDNQGGGNQGGNGGGLPGSGGEG